MLGAWCNSTLKMQAIRTVESKRVRSIYTDSQSAYGEGIGVQHSKPVFSNKAAQEPSVVHYVGIAEDEPERLARLDGVTKISPLHLIGWTEADAKEWCRQNDLLSPLYTDTCNRGGCWFCHNQGVQQLRELRHNYPDLWKLLLKWDSDSPVTFKSDGHTVHDFDKRFEMEDKGYFTADMRFRWKWLEQPPQIQCGIFEDEEFKE